MRKRQFNLSFFLSLILLILSCGQPPEPPPKISQPRGMDNPAHQWANLMLDATANDTERFRPRPTITSRYLALISIAMYDAWSRYDELALPVYLNVERRPSEEHSLLNKKIAISYAAYEAMKEYYYSDSSMLTGFMLDSLGFDPDTIVNDSTAPVSIGRMAAKSVIEARKHDGSNQYGELSDSTGYAYQDYTHYKCVNTPDSCVDLARWQPKYFADGKGGQYAPGCLTPFWQHVKPVALYSADQFRPGPPPAIGSEQLKQEVREVIDLQAGLTDEQKALVEFMRDGPSSVQQAGHWLRFAMDVSERDNHNLDEDVKMIMLVSVAAMDAFIACWDAKMFYDYARPFALVHDMFKDSMIMGWGGPDKGIVEMKGQEWKPYSPETFVCPPFPAYVSGHSTVSGACAEVLKLYTGSDQFGESIKWVPGSLTENQQFGDTIILSLPTFTETAEMAGFSRVLGGYHIQSDNLKGLELGRKVGREVYEWFEARINGKVSVLNFKF